MLAVTRAALAMGVACALVVATGATPDAATRRPLFTSNGCDVEQPAVTFPGYNPLTGTDATFTGNFTVTCTLPTEVTIALGTGSSNSFAKRTAKLGSVPINYNLFTTAAMNVVWGDGTGTTQTRSAFSFLNTTSLAIYGDVPGGQNVTAGAYTDSIPITVTLVF